MRIRLVAAAAVLSMAAPFAGAQEAPPPAEKPQEKPARPSREVRNDYTVPYLTEEKIQKLVESMKEEKNPLNFIFKDLMGMAKLSRKDVEAKTNEWNEFAKKYGFEDYEEYLAVWGRVMVGQTVIWGEGMIKAAEEMHEKMIKSAEEQLKKENLSDEMRKLYEDQLASSRKALEEMRKPKPDDKKPLNDADLALVRKYVPQIDEIQKKFKKEEEEKRKAEQERRRAEERAKENEESGEEPKEEPKEEPPPEPEEENP